MVWDTFMVLVIGANHLRKYNWKVNLVRYSYSWPQVTVTGPGGETKMV